MTVVEAIRAIARSADVGDRGKLRNLTRLEMIAMAREACDAAEIDYSIGVIASEHRYVGAKMPKDDWHKPRTQSDHFTASELEQIKVAFTQKRKPADIARELQCSTRVIHTHFAKLRRPPKEQVNRFRQRHYTSSFEI